MTEEEARALAERIAPEAMPRLERYAALLLDAADRQNLIARSTAAAIWRRHLLDSLQLARFARPDDKTWVDVGSGAGLPGIVLATLGRWRMTLVEPRRKRAEFLSETASALNLGNVSVLATDIRRIPARFDLVTARAVASVSQVLELTTDCVHSRSRYVLPKGRSARTDVDLARLSWHARFHVEQSLTDSEAGIVVADRVRRR